MATIPKPVEPSKAGAVRSAIADGLRDGGLGYARATGLLAVGADKTMINAVDAVSAAGSKLHDSVQRPSFLHKAAGWVKTGATFATAYYGLLMGGMLRAPGDLAQDVAYGLADKIDGKSTLTGDFGLGYGGANDAAKGTSLS